MALSIQFDLLSIIFMQFSWIVRDYSGSSLRILAMVSLIEGFVIRIIANLFSIDSSLPVTKTKNIDSQCINCKDKYLISSKIEVHCYKKRRSQ
jgi:hypothetical protein